MKEITHGACGRSWTGSAACHCSGCCQTFSAVSVFDAHRTQYGNRGSCKDPGTVRIDRRKLRLLDGVWHGPEKLK